LTTPECKLELELKEKFKLKLKLELKEYQFLWANVSQRNRNTWTAGAFFVPISFLIFTYTVTAEHLSRLDIVLLFSASIFTYLAWLTFHLRANRINKINMELMRNIEENLRKELKDIKIECIQLEFQPLTKIERPRKGWFEYDFPEYVFGTLWVLLLVLWLLFIH